MNIPTGKPVIKLLTLKNLNHNNMLLDLIKKKFNGYVCITVKDKYGYEDSFIVFEDGFIKGAYHRFLDKSKDSFGDNALKLFMSSFSSKLGTIDVYSLTKEQAELILTFNEKIKNKPTNDIKFLNQFNNFKYKEEILGNSSENKKETKYDLFKRIGLGNVNI